MTQRIFDVENKKDMADLWDIVPENIVRIRKGYKSEEGYYFNFYDTKDTTGFYETIFLIIDWHDKTEITRPIQEATKEDFKKLCLFWDDNYSGKGVIGLLSSIDGESVCNRYYMDGGTWWTHCRRLTKQEIEELI